MLFTLSLSHSHAATLCRVAVLVVAAIGSGGLSYAIAAEAASDREDRSPAQLVEEALRGEIEGSARRDELLQAALKQEPDYAPALWHTGHVRYGGQWLPIDEVPDRAAANKQLTMYHGAREKSPVTVSGQRELAAWCGKRGLADRERAHLTKLLELAPNDAPARARLGHVQVDGVWLSAEEVREAAARGERAAKAMLAWRPVLEGLRRDLGGVDQAERNRTFRREQALRKWEAIEDPAAIPAMELVFSAGRDPAWAELVLEKLGKMDAHEAALSLARHAVFTTSEAICRHAIEKLKLRPYEHYVPVLLSALYTPLQMRAGLYPTPDGRLLYRQLFYREGQQHQELAVLDSVFSYVPTPEGDRRTALSDAVVAAHRTRASLEATARRQDAFSQQLSARISQVLSATTGEDMPASPADWWQWWNAYNEVYVAADKPVRQAYRQQHIGVTGYPRRPPRFDAGSAFAARMEQAMNMCDCLAKGTPVWTELGPVPIERIQVGDRVLSQDPETGELAYKPVLQTTIRPTGTVFKLQLGDETIEANGGHRFWVTGQGWSKTRELEPGARLQRAAETQKIRSLDEGDAQPTYNLIVADFHTYFVASAKILAHDNTIAKPTNALLPGFLARGSEVR